MGENLLRDLRTILNDYEVAPLLTDNHLYGNLYKSARGNIIVTNKGEALCEKHPGLLLGCISKSSDYMDRRSLVDEGPNGAVYKFQVGEDILAIKEYKTDRNSGIEQLQRLAKLDWDLRDLPTIRTPQLYFASMDMLGMEFIDAPTQEEIEKRYPEKKKLLDDLFFRRSGLQESGLKIYFKFDDILVKRDPKSREYEFILIDPVN